MIRISHQHAVECITGEGKLSPHLNYFKERTNIPKFYQVHCGQKHYAVNDSITVVLFEVFCKGLGLV